MSAVELRLDTADWEKFAADHYVSVRVGECQKLSKISRSRTYKFPASSVGTRRYGRVEIFRRVGAGAVCIDPQVASGCNEVSISFEGTSINFDCNLNSDKDGAGPMAPPSPQAIPEPAKPSKAERAQAKAKEYLEEHHLEVRLSEAMQAVLRERPADPAAFLAQRLMSNAEVVAKLPKAAAKGQDEAAKKPAAAPSSSLRAAAKAEAAPAPVQAKKGPEVSLKPFAPYYMQNVGVASMKTSFDSLYAKFPSAKQAAKPEAAKAEAAKPEASKASVPFGEYYRAHMPAAVSMEGIYKRFATYNEATQKSAAPASASSGILPFSVSYMPASTLPRELYFDAYCAALQAKGAAPKVAAPKEAAAPKAAAPKAAAPKAPLGPDFRGCGQAAMESIHSRFPKYAEAKTLGAPEAVPWSVKPSVGTWLSPLKKTSSSDAPAVSTATPAAPAAASAVPAAAPAAPAAASAVPAGSWSEKPSVGSWLAPMHKTPQQVAGIVKGPAAPVPAAPGAKAPAAAAAPAVQSAASAAPAPAAPAVKLDVPASYPLPQVHVMNRGQMMGPNYYAMGLPQGLMFL